ncbi:15370_t:CDS:1 [Funneliformis geosporum]|uniref:13897_t:CDS:1 n=1 Tax=Funneliformis geosporum TaxID=1117311 RepID=A0A9W4WXA5_9GLOM|nr:13897_t:CDS:1 [Funneliformis geosporum]CAI2181984.1 15370_t:CDS:1 [Funneliformis geosporum]
MIPVKKRMNRFKSNNNDPSKNPPRANSFPISYYFPLITVVTDNVVSTLQFSFAITQALFFTIISTICTLFHVIIINYDHYYALTHNFIYSTLLFKKKGKRVNFRLSHDEYILPSFPNSRNVEMEEDVIENETKRSEEKMESVNNNKQLRADSHSTTAVAQQWDLTIDTSRKISKSYSEEYYTINILKHHSASIIKNNNVEQQRYGSLSTSTTISHSLYDVNLTFNNSKVDTRSHEISEHNTTTDDNPQLVARDTTSPSSTKGMRRHTWMTFIQKNDIQSSSTSKRNSLGIWEKVKGNINGSSRKNNDMNSNISTIIKQERSKSKLKKHKGWDPSPINFFFHSKHPSPNNFDNITTSPIPSLTHSASNSTSISPTSTLVNVSINDNVLNNNIKVRIKKRNSLQGFLKEFTNRRKICLPNGDDKNSKKKY